jgi:hypothetical protein
MAAARGAGFGLFGFLFDRTRQQLRDTKPEKAKQAKPGTVIR